MPRLQLDWNSTVKLTPRLKRWVESAAQICATELPSDVNTALLSVGFCGDLRMRAVNRTHRNKDRTTDVLSFPLQANIRRNCKRDWIRPGVLPLGDLLVSLPQARRQALNFGLSLEEEVVHLFIHGFLHLIGYDHEISKKEERSMEIREAYLLEKFSQQRPK